MLLSIKETATRLGISADTVHRRIRAGALDAHKQNGQWRVEVGGADALADAPADAPGPTHYRHVRGSYGPAGHERPANRTPAHPLDAIRTCPSICTSRT